MIDRLEVTLNRYNEITSQLSDPSIVSDIKKMTMRSDGLSCFISIGFCYYRFLIYVFD